MAGRRPHGVNPAGRGRRIALLAGAAASLALVLSACGGKAHKQTTLSPHGSQAQEIANLINPVFGIAAFVFVAVLGGALFISLKFRVKDDEEFFDDAQSPKQLHGAFKLEIGWTIVPALVLLVVGVFTVGTIFKLAQPAPKNSIHVEVIGQQWWWEYRYDLNGDGKYDNITTANDLVIPEGQKVEISMTSRDVIHSFWIPALNGKKDAVPNHHSPIILQSNVVGHEVDFVGQCTEFCGLSHANMRMKVISLPAGQFDQWARNQQRKAESGTFPKSDTSDAALGQQYFLGAKCAQCHVIDGVNNKNFTTDVITGANFNLPSSKANTVVVRHKIINGKNVNTWVQTSGAAPNLTHLMTRTTFAGGLFDLRIDDGPNGYCTRLGIHWSDTDKNLNRCLNVPALKNWLRNPPAAKPMAPIGVPNKSGPRGMPNLNLTETQIDQVIAYLKTLK